MDANESYDKFLRIEIVSSSIEDSGDVAPNANYFIGSMDGPVVRRVKTFHISSTILTAQSKFISKLFSNGTEVFDQEHVTIQIKESEAAAFIELLNFMYSDTLFSTTAPELLNIMMVAINFEVDSCMRHCTLLLRNIPMTTELALLYLELVPQISLVETVQPLTDAAKLFLRSRYKDIIMYEEELMGLPLCGIEAILSADDLHVTSEDYLFDFVLKWAKVHYPKLEERREIISSRLINHIRFPYMSSQRLLEVPKCTDLDKHLAFVSVHNALLSKLDALFVKAYYLQNITSINMDGLSIGPTNVKCEIDQD